MIYTYICLMNRYFEGQFISRADMWRLKRYLCKTCGYTDKEVRLSRLTATIGEVLINGVRMSCGYITESTKFIFRSRSARVFWMIQMSREMWEFSDDGDLHWEKVVSGFMLSIFEKWKSLNVRHSLSIVFFSRLYFDGTAPSDWCPFEALNIDAEGRL